MIAQIWRSRVRLGLLLLNVVLLTATLWYWQVEGFSLIDAAYQTVVTISTVGFDEVEPLDTTGRLFTILVILVGVGVMLYTVTALFEEILEDQVGRIGRRRLQRRIARMKGHAVVCGYGRVGRTAARLVDEHIDAVVVEADPEKARAATDAGLTTIEGDATEDDTLVAAGIARAGVLVAALPTDADNLYIVITARAANPDLHIVARARAEASEQKLLRAGANRVINPQDIGGRRLAAFALQPAVSDFLDVVMHQLGSVEYRLEEFVIPDGAPFAGRTIRDTHIRDHTGALVLALRDPGGDFVTNPAPETALEAGMTVIAIGTNDQLARLNDYVTSASV